MSQLFLFKNLILLFMIGAYFSSRIFGMLYFTPHNDEVIYAQLARVISENWQENKYLSLHAMGEDYFEPLQFWVTAWTVNWWKDPLIGIRIWSLFTGFLGLLFTLLLVSRMWNWTAAIFTGILIVFSEYFFYFDSLSMNEVHLYGLGSVFLYLLYESLPHQKWKHLILANLIFIAMLTTKISGQFWIVFAVLLPILVIIVENSTLKDMRKAFKQHGLRMYATVIGVVLIGYVVHSVLIPSEFLALKSVSWQAGLVRDFNELLTFPFSDWNNNFQYYFDQILWREFPYLIVPILVLIGGVAIWLWRKQRNLFWRYLCLILFFFSSFIPLILVAKTTAIRHFGIGLYFFYILLGVALAVGYERQTRIIRQIAITVTLFALIGWKGMTSYAFLLQWEQTEMATHETLGWANGAGMREMVRRISKLPAGVLITDERRGHPGTTIHLFNKYYPQLKLVDLNQQVFNNLEHYHKTAQSKGQNLYIVFDQGKFGGRNWADFIVNHKQFCAKKDVISKIFRGRVMENTAIVICQAGKYIENGDENYYRLAVEKLTKAIQQDPESIQNYYQRGNLYVALKQHQNAIEDLNKVIENKIIPGVYLTRGNAYLGLGQYQNAINDLTKEIELNSKNAVIYNNRGFAYKTLKQYNKAIDDFSKAIEINPKFQRSYHHRGMIHMEMGKHILACNDWRQACQLGSCDDFQSALEKGRCVP